MKQENSDTPVKKHSQGEVSPEALAWAEFLYDEYLINKHKHLLLAERNTKIESNNGVADD